MTSTNLTRVVPPSPHRNSGSGQPQPRQTKEEVQVDLSSMIGRIKPKPVCVDPTLKQQSMSHNEISKFVFVTGEKTSLDTGSQELSVVSSSSSTGSRENGLLDKYSSPTSAAAADGDGDAKQALTPPFADGRFLHRKSESERINLKVKAQTISRNGRQTQRWYTDPSTHTMYRMTTGCIPVMKDGKILFCSASRKSEWILPKGGWEKDEAMEESAIRETFEEGGVFGIIGPTLSEIEFETRKGKKRRIEFEEVKRKAKMIREASSSSPKAVPLTEEAVAKSETERAAQGGGQNQKQTHQSKTTPQCSDWDTGSVASETSLSHTHVKMTLFPLYVTEVMESWPEQGRFRKVVNIDEAIQLTESRPYFREALQELKQRKLHLSQDLQNYNKNDTNVTRSITDTSEDIAT
eukprot:CAMPEP_0201120222 /NCGR_PEP_ID=MMETSP0850-20130426/4306_1 /ASSEMBLY_ACC=CAM_ASM_000622 /TAXON_ID=183588 /ORGANISM="Pseudo-nitzschia fraudulenta, Strain WWA7" /LENGTH=406 /DNA_ID=CAMNT_0047386283 /DNA_START=271 /DNA_END=1491 /DNA_ORIENTATION=+